jgi:hypothetical protein
MRASAARSDALRVHRISLTLAALAAAATLAAPASAAGGSFVFDGGSARQQATVRAALAASAFDWNVLPQITVHIARGSDSYAKPGQIWLDADLLDAGRFAWGTVQHELAHQVDFALLDQSKRTALQSLLGGGDWCYESPGVGHDAHGCERFADTLAAAYWPSADNTARAWAPAGKFRTLLAGMLGSQRGLAAVRR